MHEMLRQPGKSAGAYLDVPNQLSQEEQGRLRHGVYLRPGRSCKAASLPSAATHTPKQLTLQEQLPSLNGQKENYLGECFRYR